MAAVTFAGSGARSAQPAISQEEPGHERAFARLAIGQRPDPQAREDEQQHGLLRKVFVAEDAARNGALPAAALLRGMKLSVRTTLERRAGADRYAARQLVRLAIERCEQLKLYQRGSRRVLLPKLRTALVRMARGYIASDELRLRL